MQKCKKFWLSQWFERVKTQKKWSSRRGQSTSSWIALSKIFDFQVISTTTCWSYWSKEKVYRLSISKKLSNFLTFTIVGILCVEASLHEGSVAQSP